MRNQREVRRRRKDYKEGERREKEVGEEEEGKK
jgi:hypothetical protein